MRRTPVSCFWLTLLAMSLGGCAGGVRLARPDAPHPSLPTLFSRTPPGWNGYGTLDIDVDAGRLRGSFEISRSTATEGEALLYTPWGGKAARLQIEEDSVLFEGGNGLFLRKAFADSAGETGLLKGVGFTFEEMVRILYAEPVRVPVRSVPDTVVPLSRGGFEARWVQSGGRITVEYSRRGVRRLRIEGEDSLLVVVYELWGSGGWSRVVARDARGTEVRIVYEKRGALEPRHTFVQEE